MKLPYDASPTVGREFIDLPPEFVAAILRTLQAGWSRAVESPDVHQKAHEVAITERLREGMRVAVEFFPWAKAMTILPGTESRSSLDQLTPDGRTDIPIFLIPVFEKHREHEPHAIIECKRVAGTSSRLCREYVVEGIDRFRTGKYAENHAFGFMAGYLLTGDSATTVSGINAYFTRQSRSTELLAESDLLEEPEFWQSKHPRNSPRDPIDLHHAFFRIKRKAL